MIQFIKDMLHELRTKDKCFAQNKNKNGVCYGKHGGDQYTEYLSHSCVDCPHLTFIFSEELQKKIIEISNNKQKSKLDDVPLNTPVYLIDHNHNLYIGTIIKTVTGELQRGECFSGDAEYFYRNAIVDWAYL